MDNAEPTFDPDTRYQIEVRGNLDAGWLQSFDGLMENSVHEIKQTEETTVINIHTDQSGIVGLVRRLHGLGITILQFQLILPKEK